MTDPNSIPPSDPTPPPVTGYQPNITNSDPTYVGPPPDADAKSMAGLAHFFNVIPLIPLLIYLIKKDSHPYVKHQSAEALNFSLTCLIIHVACGVTSFLCVPALVSLVLLIGQIVLGIIGGLKAKEGIPYKYFATIKMVS